ncbi:MAG TPA: CYTH and CHAD domain-containing protein [Pedococcus sp.]|jgi:CHAD domain-containing protein
MAGGEHLEVERKYDAPAARSLAEALAAGGVRVGSPTEQVLEAVYHDTPSLDLARAGVTLRRRSGGDDAGWHLKLPAGGDARTETRLPLGADDEPVPPPLLATVGDLTRDTATVPVATVRTHREVVPVLAEDGRVVALACDDDVTARRLGTAPAEQRWREWEVELAGGDVDDLEHLEQVLLGVGARRSSTGSKARRALGLAPSGASVPAPPAVGRGSSAADVLVAYAATHAARLVASEATVREDAPDSVHQMRVAARRLRSVLATYRPLLADHQRVADLRVELRWLGQVMGQARDGEVLAARLSDTVAQGPPDPDVDAAAARVGERLTGEARAGRGAALEALDSPRFRRLLDDLTALLADPGWTPLAARRARKVVPRLLRGDLRRLRRAIRTVRHAGTPAERDAALHEARKKAKRLRYAAESAVPVLGPTAEDLVERATDLQDALGEHQDSVVARERLQAIAGESADDAFALGRLHALEERRAEAAERDFLDVWARMPHRWRDRRRA